MQKKRVWFNAKPALDSSEIEAVYHVLNSMSASDDADEIMEQLVLSLQADTRAVIVAIFRLEGGRSSELELVKAIDAKGVSRYLSKVIRGDIAMDWGFVPAMIADFMPRLFDLATFKEHPTAKALVEKYDLKGSICVPIALDGAIEGFYSLLYEEVPEVDEQDFSFYIMLGGAIAAVMKHCDLLERYEALEKSLASKERREAIRMHAQALCGLLDDLAKDADGVHAHERPAIGGPSDLHQPFADLTQGELNVLTLVSAGLSNSEIANHLFISEGTVKKRIGNIMVKLNLKNRTQMGVYYARFAR